MKQSIKIAARKTPLSLAQANFVAQKIQNLGFTTNIIEVVTSGDLNLQAKLEENIQFFTKEVDLAIKNNEADISVHSLKDVSLDRPSWIKPLAFFEREDPRDIIIFDKKLNLKSATHIKIGTSSPRRQYMLLKHLEDFLPKGKDRKTFSFCNIRGKVETRLASISNSCDCAVLALAGLKRLFSSNSLSFDDFCQKYSFMILPFSVFTPTAGQGMIYAECHKDFKFYNILSQLNSYEDEICANIERDFLSQNGRGCHQKFGVLSFGTTKLGEKMLYQSGISESGTELKTPTLYDQIYSRHGTNIKIFDSLNSKSFIRKKLKYNKDIIKNSQNIFIANANSIDLELVELLQNKNLYCSGTSSFKKLASMGLFINSCFDNLGFDFGMKMLTNSTFFPQNILTLTHLDSKNLYQNALFTYKIEFEENRDEEEIKNADFIIWRSDMHQKYLQQYAKDNTPQIFA